MKKKSSDVRKTSELLQKLQASVLSEKRQEPPSAKDADDLAFQEKIADMLKGLGGEQNSGAEKGKQAQARSGVPKKPEAPTGSEAQAAHVAPAERADTAESRPQEKHVPRALLTLTESTDTAEPAEAKMPAERADTDPVLEIESQPEPELARAAELSKPKQIKQAKKQAPTEERSAKRQKPEKRAGGTVTQPANEPVKQPEKREVEQPAEKQPITKHTDKATPEGIVQPDARTATPKPTVQAADTAEEKPIVIGAPSKPGDSAREPIVIRPRSAAPRAEAKRVGAEEKPSTVSDQPIKVVPPRVEAPAAQGERTGGRRTGGVSLPRTRTAERQGGGSAKRPQKKTATSAELEAAKAAAKATKRTAAEDARRGGLRAPGKKTKQVQKTPITTLPQDDLLDEALDDTVTGAVPELLPMDEPESTERSDSRQGTSIFARRRARKKQEADNVDALELIKSRTGMSEDDIAMILELGYDNELGRLVGYETLKKLRCEHLQRRTHDASGRLFCTAFGYRGEERSTPQTALASYARDRKPLLWRTVLTALFALLLAFLELPVLSGGVLLPYSASFPWLFPLLRVCLLAGAAALSYRQILAGARSWFRFTPTPYSTVALLVPIALLYGLADLFSGGTAGLLPMGFGTASALLLTALCDVLRLSSEMRTLRILAADGQKTVLDAAEPRKKKLRNGERIVRIINDEIDQRLYRVRKTDEVTGFFRRNNDLSSAGVPFAILLGLMLAISVLCGLLGAVRADSVAAGASAFASALMFLTPTPAILLYFYPLCRANKALSYRNAALIGEESVEEYSEPKTVIFHDSDMYTAQKCTQISVRDGEDFRQDMRLAGVLFRKIGGTLGSLGAAGAGSAPENDPPVVFLRMTDGGTEAMIGNRYHVLAGNATFLAKSGVRIPRESTDRQARRTDGVSLMYVAIDGVLKLSYEIEYTASATFERMAGLLAEADTVTAIQTYDPNLCEAFLRASRGEDAVEIRVIKPGRYEQDGVQSVVDTGAVALGATTDITAPICAASAVSGLRRTGYRVLGVAATVCAILGALAELFVPALSFSARVLLPLAFRLACDLAVAVAAGTILPLDGRNN